MTDTPTAAPTCKLAKFVVSCQYWEWYGNEDFTLGRYKPKGGEEFIVDLDPYHDEQEMIAAWNAEHNRDGKWTRFEARSISPYWEPRHATFTDGKFVIGIPIGEL